jgi:putative nucleotide binding protein
LSRFVSNREHYNKGATSASGESYSLRKFEEYAYVLDYIQNARSSIVRMREGIIIHAIGEEHLTTLELLGISNQKFSIGERVYIGKDGRTKIISVLGRLDFNHLSPTAKNELPTVIEKIVTVNENRFIYYFNTAQAMTPRVHSLELIPGIGKTYMRSILTEREKKKFESFADLQSRTGLRDVPKHLAKRILDEISGETRMNIFVRK